MTELDTGQITKLGSTIASDSVDDEQLSSDGTRVVFRPFAASRDRRLH